MRLFYNLIVYLLAPLVVLFMFWRGISNRAYWARWSERYGFVPKLGGPPAIWIHAVSVGEVQAALPLVKALLQRYPNHQIVVTTITPTGSARVRETLGDKVKHYYVPYDFPFAVRRFLKRIKPSMAVIMETELWPNLYYYCGRYEIPLIMASARLSQRSARGYRRIPGPSLVKQMLDQVSVVAAQSKADADRIIELGAEPAQVQVTGNIKFDLDVPKDFPERGAAIRLAWGSKRPVWIAASTHEGEEESVLVAHQQILQQVPDAILVLAVRHPERFAAVASMCRKKGFEVAQHSRQQTCSAQQSIFLLDTLGELQLFFAAADVAFVAGSLMPIGGHNMLEPAAQGLPVVTGPHNDNWEEIAALLMDVGGMQQLENGDALGAAILALLSDPVARERMGKACCTVVLQNRGALAKLLTLIDQHLV